MTSQDEGIGLSTSNGVRCGAGLSESDEPSIAVEQAFEQAQEQLGCDADLAFVFFSADHSATSIRDQLAKRVGKATLLGACGESIVGTRTEVERTSAVSVWLASLPGASIKAFHLDYDATVDQGTFLGWTDELLDAWPSPSVMILLGEPFTFPADRFAAVLNEEHPGVPIVGGMASGADRPGVDSLILNGEVYSSGAVGVRLSGELGARTVVSQGCMPVGQPLVITKADRNVIYELGGKSALVQLQGLIEQMSEEDREKATHGLHIGRVINEYKDSFTRGDFLVRNLIGIDQRSGAIAIGDYVRAGQTVQFHIRDAESADEDLRRMLSDAAEQGTPNGGLLFSCNGRGSRLFTSASHDALAVAQAMGDVPLAGFFAAGELGPVGGRNFLHGFTASLLLFGKASS
jgi:small ligand-binding sensory domain FIST